MKRVLSLFLSVLMLTSVVAAVDLSAYAATSASGICGDNLTWKLENGTLTISGKGDMENYNDENIFAPWYYYSDISEIIISDGITSIGAFAFQRCDNLVSVTIADSVTSINNYAFNRCTNLPSIVLPDSITSIGTFAFHKCTNLKSVKLSSNIITLSLGLFQDCSNLTSIQIPYGVTTIGDWVFWGCSSLTTVIVPHGVTSIGGLAFDDCSRLSTVTLPSTLASIGNGAFMSCDRLTRVYYCGSQDDWEKIDIDVYNSLLTDATFKYNYKCSTHNWDSGKTTTAATCSVTGVKTYTCTVCGATKTETIAKTTTHTWNSGKTTTAATCSATGVKTYTCTVCGATKTETIAATGNHNYKNVITKATTSKNGKITPTCSVCGKTKTATTIYKPKSMALSTSSYTYNGKSRKPSVTVKDSNGSKISSKYYTVSYISRSTGKKVSSMKNPGKYYVKVTFKTRYSGSIKKAVTIKPKKTSIKSIKASKKGFTVKWGKVSTQNTGYQIQYSTSKSFKNAKTVTVRKTGTTSKKVTKLKAKKKYYVRVRTYKTVKINGKNTKIYSSWSSAKGVTTKK